MERHCKNCNELIYAEKSHCSNCGAKWIENRITMKQVAHDFGDMYLGIDTKFVRTFIDLFKKPEAVILGYINGRRVNYMDAVRYLLLAMFVTGIYTFFLKNTGIIEDMMDAQIEANVALYSNLQIPKEQLTKQMEGSKKFTQLAFEFQGFIFLITIPFLALIGRITFRGKRYFNFTEQMVFYMYTYGHSVIVTTPFTILLLFLFPKFIMYIGFISFPLMYLYNMYCYKRCFKMDKMSIVTKTLMSAFIGLGIFIALCILMGILIIIGAIIAKVMGAV